MTNPKATYLRISFGFLAIAAFAAILPIVIPDLDFIRVPGVIGAIIGAALSAIFSLTNPKG